MLVTSPAQFEKFLVAPEGTRLEFKAAKSSYEFDKLIEIGAVESQGKGKGTRYFLSRELREIMGTPGAYTRQRGLDNETNKALLLKHLQDRLVEGAKLAELCQVLPANSSKTVQRMLNELRCEGRIALIGKTNAARWFCTQDPKGSELGHQDP